MQEALEDAPPELPLRGADRADVAITATGIRVDPCASLET